MNAATLPAAPTLSDRFGWIADGLCRLFFSRMYPGSPLLPLMILLRRRLRLVQRRFARLAALAQAGKLPPPRRRAATPPAATPSAATPPADTPVGGRARRPENLYPRGIGWLSRMLPWQPGVIYHGAIYGRALRELLSDPEAAALLRAAPQLQRLLRPICRMLGQPDIPALQPPARPARPRPRTPPLDPATPRPLTDGQLRWLLFRGRRVPSDGMYCPATDGYVGSARMPAGAKSG